MTAPKKYPLIVRCPCCGKEIKQNKDISFRCRTCQTEFIIWVSYDPKEDKTYWYNFKKQKLEEEKGK
jgi:hypothetical protein